MTMTRRKMVLTASLAAIMAFAMAYSTGAMDNVQKTNYLTFSGSFQIPGKVLGPGTYIFELPDPQGAWSLVRVSSRDRKTIYLTAFTMVVDRPSNVPQDQLVTFGEASRSTPPPLKVWYPMHESTGRAFIY
jgi:hypothetical protein